jgi:hypothetical protein
MQVTIFSKKQTAKDGRQFYTYFGRLTKKDGTEVTANFKFRESCGAPDGGKCPINIVFEKTSANFTQKQETYTDAEGIEKEVVRQTVWLSDWTEGEPYVDHSMDDFAD